MCTVSWTHQSDGYELLCNRDERHTRAEALPPEVHTQDGVRFIAPIDPDFGGTWIAANEFGLTLCLLNGSGRHSNAAGMSRGLLIPMVIASTDTEQACDRLDAIDLSTFAPFTLAILSPAESVVIFEWDGRRGVVGPAHTSMLSSSSFESESVQSTRRDDFERHRQRGKTLFEFHSSHTPKGGAHSVCMHRDDAETVSFSWIRVTGNEIRFFYAPGAPCQWMPGDQRMLELRRAA